MHIHTKYLLVIARDWITITFYISPAPFSVSLDSQATFETIQSQYLLSFPTPPIQIQVFFFGEGGIVRNTLNIVCPSGTFMLYNLAVELSPGVSLNYSLSFVVPSIIHRHINIYGMTGYDVSLFAIIKLGFLAWVW